MTLCIAWRSQNGDIHLAADSLITLGHSSVDFGIKVASLPYKVFPPAFENEELATPHDVGEIGICFAGSTVTLFGIKETVSEFLTHLQRINLNPVSLKDLCELIYAIYLKFVPRMVDAVLGGSGVVNMVVAGHCEANGISRAFLISTDKQNQSSMREVLSNGERYIVIGSGRGAAIKLLEKRERNDRWSYLDILQDVIDDAEIKDVGGNITYGHTSPRRFSTFATQTISGGKVSYWRGGLDYNTPPFDMTNSSGLLVTYPMIVRK